MSKKLFGKFFIFLLVAALLFAALPMKAVQAEAAEVNPALQAGANRLVSLQNNDGGWDWELTDGDPETGSALNTIAPIGMGLAQAYLHTADPDHLTALDKAGDLLLTKTIFSSQDGYLAAQLDEIFGGTTYTTYLKTNFYDKLAAGTYVGTGGTYNTQTYISALRNGRTGRQANLAAWDVGLGLVAAASCGVTSAELQHWIDGVKAEINELDDYYDADPTQTMSYLPIGLAGALYGLAYVDQDFNPDSGYYASAEDIGDLFDGLLDLQNGSGGFVWHPAFTLENDQNEGSQATAYAMLALNEYNRTAYLSNIQAAADYLLGIQLSTGGWDNYPAVGQYPASGENNEVTAEVMWGIATAYPEVWVCPIGDCGHPGFEFDTIQGAIDAVDIGGMVNVLPGTYAEAITLDKPNITVKSTGGADETIIDVPDGTLTTGVRVLANMGTVTFDGFTVKDFTEGGIIQGMASGTGTTFHVLNNVIQPFGGYLRNGIQVSGDGSTVVGNTITSAYLTSDWASTAIGVVDANNVIVRDNTISGVGDYGISAYTWEDTTMSNIDILDNTITGIDYPLGVIAYNDGTVSDVVLTHNKVSDYLVAIEAEAYQEEGYNEYWGTLVENVDAIHNWWGSIAGPTNPVGVAVYSPWCGNAECTTFLPDDNGEIELPEGVTPDEIQTAINNAPEGTTIIIPDGVYSHTGAFVISTPNITIKLSDGTVIQNNSPCFTVTADHTKITTESIGGAVCVPTGGDHGIVVNENLTDITIEGIEISGIDINGIDQTTGDGIHFAGAITDVIVRDNFIHELDVDGVHFTAQPANYVEIKGNLFMGNTGLGVNNAAGSTAIDATYNSWGDYAGPTGANGDGVSANVTYSPYTHVDVYVEYDDASSRYADEVAVGETITYNVYANLQNALGAQFTLTFDPAKLQVTGTDTTGTVFPDIWSGSEVAPGVDYNNTTGKITFSGGATSAVSGTDRFIYSVTFTGLDDTPLANPLSFAATDKALFGMNPTYGSSLNIYAAGMVGVADVNVYDLPTLAIDPLATYAVGNPKEFTLTVTNPATGRAYTNLDVELSGLSATLEYLDGSAWAPYTQGAEIVTGPLAVGSTDTVDFRVTFTAAGTDTATVNLDDDTTFLVTKDFGFTVLDAYTVTGTVQMQGRTVRSGVSIGLAGITYPEYLYSTLSNDFMTGNYTLSNVAAGEYTLTMTHDRYLDFTYTTYSLTANDDLTRLELRGGDVAKNNEINIADASVVGADYYETGDKDGDANFDEIVNIFDLAMVGGNYGLTSETAYTSWEP